MPIYAYRCESCGHAMDVLRKVSDPALTTCPACGAQALRKQVTAAGFQLKGSGWYVTDFRGGPQSGAGSAKSTSTTESASEAKSPGNDGAAPASGAGAETPAKAAPAPAAAAGAPASGAAPAAGGPTKSTP